MQRSKFAGPEERRGRTSFEISACKNATSFIYDEGEFYSFDGPDRRCIAKSIREYRR